MAGRRGRGEEEEGGSNREERGWHPSSGVKMNSPRRSWLDVDSRVGNSLQLVSTVSSIGLSASGHVNVM